MGRDRPRRNRQKSADCRGDEPGADHRGLLLRNPRAIPTFPRVPERERRGDPLVRRAPRDRAPRSRARRSPRQSSASIKPRRCMSHARQRAGSAASAAIASASAPTSPGGTRMPLSPLPRDRLAAARHVAGNDRPGTGGGFEQGFRHPFAIGRRQHRDRRAAPHLAHVGDRRRASVTPGSAASADSDLRRQRAGIVGVGRTGQDPARPAGRARAAAGLRRPRRARPCRAACARRARS